MTPQQFVDRAVGVPWRRWASGWDAMDCFGLVVLWHREVLGINVGEVPQTDIASGFAGITGWVECAPRVGVTGFMSWRDGAPTHCGVLALPGLLLHAQEGTDIPGRGSVRMTRLAALQRLCGDIRFYRFDGEQAC